MPGSARIRVPASTANLGPGFDVLSLALKLYLEVEARESPGITITWKGTGANDVALDHHNLLVRAAQEPFAGWTRPLKGLALRVRNQIPIGRGLGSSAAALVGGIAIGARLRGLRMTRQRIIELALPLEGHADNLAAALYGGFNIAAVENGGVRAHRLDWPPAWRAVVFIPDHPSPTHHARRLVPSHPALADAVFNLGRVAEWVLAVQQKDRSLLRSSMDDRLHQPGRIAAYPYLDDMIAAAEQAGALGAALSGAGGSVIAIADRALKKIAEAMPTAAAAHGLAGSTMTLSVAARGPRL